MELAIRITLSLVVGYLTGSLSPAYILGRLLKGVGIRTVNFRAAGARNVKAALGAWPAAVTATVELYSERLDDNFSVSLLSGGFLFALRYFLKI